ncbi:DUF397 domain-containing protein [Streptomyces spongiicola]|uniref:DUF397 domain-containing protein n=1 Tax=Streptomyces spongiicola TaxID=1690221 RepID=A0A2S1YZN0_9ACTN|nr:DUF397 domain-containing protein [Streptomyces spongiicola]AWK09463.1 DUF397 domain-containing protein [Streptomyces spongiicola]GBQ03342.1 DUF397 domain-containing protein [Streptomyces spongiicola]
MTPAPDPTIAVWRKSSYSNGDGGACLEVADSPRLTSVRDSKVPDGPALLVPNRTWVAFVEAVKGGTLGQG